VPNQFRQVNFINATWKLEEVQENEVPEYDPGPPGIVDRGNGKGSGYAEGGPQATSEVPSLVSLPVGYLRAFSH
jgi:hypothetical protein